jgi:hypothetical protein
MRPKKNNPFRVFRGKAKGQIMTYKFKKMCEVYKIFAKEWDCDFSEKAMQEMFEFESHGKGDIDISGFNVTNKKTNGFAVGKKWLNVNVAMWFEEIDKYGWLQVIKKLYGDNIFPHWWLNEIFKNFLKKKAKFYRDEDISWDEETFLMYFI